MVALSSLNELKKSVMNYSTVSIYGLNMAGDECKYLSKTQSRTAFEPRFFEISEKVCYYQEPTTQYFRKGRGKNINISKPAFLHFKNVKNIDSATAIWPKGWEKMPMFKRFINRRHPGKRYEGEIPKALKEKYDI